MTSPRQKKKKLAILKMLKKQKEAAAEKLEKSAVIDMNKNLLKGSQKHVTDLPDQKQTESSEQIKNALKELKNKKSEKVNKVESVITAEQKQPITETAIENITNSETDKKS